MHMEVAILPHEAEALLELFCLQPIVFGWRQNNPSSSFASWGKMKIHDFTTADQDWIGLMIFKNFADQDWIGFNFIGSVLDSDWKILQSAHLCYTAYQAVRYTAEIKQRDDTTWQLRHKSRKNVILWISRPDAIVIDHSLRVGLVKAGPEKYQNKGPFVAPLLVIARRNCEEVFLKKSFYKTLKNGDRILRSWLLNWKLECGLYWFCCMLFQLGNDHSLLQKLRKLFWMCLAWDWRSLLHFFSIDKSAKRISSLQND